MPPDEPPPDEPLGGLLRKASPGGDLLARAALGKLQARLFGQADASIRVGRYVLEERIGAGGSGVVYRAFDPKHERKVALKLLHAREGDDHAAARARLLREAQALAKLSHPNIVRILDVGTVEPTVLEPGYDEGVGPRAPAVYLVMELLDGCDLERWLAAEPRGWQAVREVFLAAGRGLAAAHAQGLVHRDFKPANVSIDAEGRARVLDFGLARPLPVQASEDALAAALGSDAFGARRPSLRMTGGAHQRLDALARPLAATLTVPGTLLGTPAYMAPEQHERQRATAKSDQYGFCVSLYEAWYGQRPFLATSEVELRALARQGNVRPPPLDTDVPPHLWSVLRRGLSPQPEDRFESMDALLAALAEPARPERPRWWRPVAAGVVAAATIGGLAWLLAGRAEQTTAVIACAERQHERTAALLQVAREADETARRRVADVLPRWPGTSRCDDTGGGLAATDDAFADSLLRAAEGRFAEALERAREARAQAEGHGDTDRLREAAAWLGHLELEHGDPSRAEPELAEALWTDDDAASEASLLATLDLLELARRRSPRPRDAPLWIRLARERAALPTSPPELRARLYLGLHRLALADGDLARAELELQQALALPLDEADAQQARRALAEARASRTPARP